MYHMEIYNISKNSYSYSLIYNGISIYLSIIVSIIFSVFLYFCIYRNMYYEYYPYLQKIYFIYILPLMLM